jgi:hypothetical protein
LSHLDRTNWRADTTFAAWFEVANSAETRRSIPSDAGLTAIPANCIETGHHKQGRLIPLMKTAYFFMDSDDYPSNSAEDAGGQDD